MIDRRKFVQGLLLSSATVSVLPVPDFSKVTTSQYIIPGKSLYANDNIGIQEQLWSTIDNLTGKIVGITRVPDSYLRYPNQIATEFVNVQPIDGQVGEIFTVKAI
jgi:hypothetical protein